MMPTEYDNVSFESVASSFNTLCCPLQVCFKRTGVTWNVEDKVTTEDNYVIPSDMFNGQLLGIKFLHTGSVQLFIESPISSGNVWTQNELASYWLYAYNKIKGSSLVLAINSFQSIRVRTHDNNKAVLDTLFPLSYRRQFFTKGCTSSLLTQRNALLQWSSFVSNYQRCRLHTNVPALPLCSTNKTNLHTPLLYYPLPVRRISNSQSGSTKKKRKINKSSSSCIKKSKSVILTAKCDHSLIIGSNGISLDDRVLNERTLVDILSPLPLEEEEEDVKTNNLNEEEHEDSMFMLDQIDLSSFLANSSSSSTFFQSYSQCNSRSTSPIRCEHELRAFRCNDSNRSSPFLQCESKPSSPLIQPIVSPRINGFSPDMTMSPCLLPPSCSVFSFINPNVSRRLFI